MNADAAIDGPVDSVDSVDATAPPPAIASVAIAGAPNSNQVRQNARMTRLVVTGENLGNVDAVTIGEWTTAPLPNSTDTLLLVDVYIPSGTLLGSRTLTVSSGSGSDSLANAIAVTEITSSPGGSDAAGRGTPDAPFATIGHATSVAGSSAQPGTGDTIRLLPGIYGSAETWPIPLRYQIRLRGDDRSTTILRASNNQQTGISANKDSTVEDLTIDGFRYGVSGAGELISNTGTAVMRRMTFIGCETALNLSNNVVVEDILVRGSLRALAWYRFTSVGVTAVVRGLVAHAPSDDSVSWNAIEISGGPGTMTASSFSLENSRIEDSSALNPGYALRVVDGSGGGGGLSVRVRSTTLAAERGVLVYGDFDPIDFGTSSSFGLNAIACTYRCIDDQRAARPAADGAVFSLVGTTLNGTLRPPGFVTGPAFLHPFYNVANSNNRLLF